MSKSFSVILIVLGLSASAFAQSFTDFSSELQQVVVFSNVRAAQWYRDWVVRHYLSDTPNDTVAVRVNSGDTLVVEMRMNPSFARFQYLVGEGDCRHEFHDLFKPEYPTDVTVLRDGTEIEVGLIWRHLSTLAFVHIDSSEYYRGSDPTPRWSFGQPATAEAQARLQEIVNRLPEAVRRRVASYGLATVPKFDFEYR